MLQNLIQISTSQTCALKENIFLGYYVEGTIVAEQFLCNGIFRKTYNHFLKNQWQN